MLQFLPISLIGEVIDRVSIEFNVGILIKSLEPQLIQVERPSKLLILQLLLYFLITVEHIISLCLLLSEDLRFELTIVLAFILISPVPRHSTPHA